MPAAVGQPAPDFALTDATGQTQSLAQQRGKVVVLEWFNPQCPFVQKHYRSGNMQRLQHEAAGQGVVWWSINSSAAGNEGHLSPELAKQVLAELNASPSALLLDADGTVGRRYGAKTTPHMFVINAAGVLVYAGAIDDIRSVDPADVDKAVNYVRQALGETAASKSVSVAETKPYGCSVKY